MDLKDKITAYRKFQHISGHYVLQVESGELVCYCDEANANLRKSLSDADGSLKFKNGVVKSLSENGSNDNWVCNVDRETILTDKDYLKNLPWSVFVSIPKPTPTFSPFDMERLGIVGLYINPKAEPKTKGAANESRPTESTVPSR